MESYKKGLALRMNHRMKQLIELNRERLSHAAKRLQYLSPANRLNENRRRVMEYEEKLTLLMNGTLQEKRNRLAMLSQALEGNSPVKKLSQGYAFVEGPDHKALKSITNIRIKDQITVQLLDGCVHAVVSEVAENE
jgi:exodeoxyribonuclease VII large subunit